jgi:hypothetical protein
MDCEGPRVIVLSPLQEIASISAPLPNCVPVYSCVFPRGSYGLPVTVRYSFTCLNTSIPGWIFAVG